MAVNSFNVLDGEMNSIGTGMYLAASVLDHNCKPNAVATFNGRSLNIRTLVDMPIINWDTIFISYIDLMDDTETRRASLKKNYYFLCMCSKCVSHKEEERNLYAALCPGCKVEYCISEKVCSTCGYNATPEFIKEYQEVTDFSKMKLTEMSNTACKNFTTECWCCDSQWDSFFYRSGYGQSLFKETRKCPPSNEYFAGEDSGRCV